MKTYAPLQFFLCSSLLFLAVIGYTQPLKVVLAGLSHDHVNSVLHAFGKGEVQIIGIAENDQQLVQKFKKRNQLHDTLFFNTLKDLLKTRKPDVVLAYNAISDHLSVVETAAPLGIPVMVEKPLATTVKDAERIAELSRQYKVPVLTNYETIWYSSNQEIYKLVKDSNAIGNIRKMVVHDGHQGPKEIGCSPAFLQWLTDPVKNGAGALNDFGCYGANLMTWLMDGTKPIAVTAITRQLKPTVYPLVDDDATILLEYSNGATGIVEASWNWPFSIKDLEIYGQTGYAQAVNSNTLRLRIKENQPYTVRPAIPTPSPLTDHLSYLSAYFSGKIKPANDLSSLENNIIVVRILEAAKQSAKEGKRILLSQ
jgi:predicted dehydrogenase